MARPSVIAFAGHMMDTPTRVPARFPRSAEPTVAAALARELDRLNARAGVCSLASGGDILFAQAILARGGQVHLIFPLNIEEFLENSVRPCGDPVWERRFHEIRAKATSEQIVGDDYVRESGTPFQLAALLIDGETQIIARESGCRAAALAVWDGKPGDGMGGAASFVGHCYVRGRDTTSIHPTTGAATTPGPETVAAAQKHTWRVVQAGDTTLEHRLAAFLFADAKGFSTLDESQMPAFIRVMLGVMRAAIAELGIEPLVVNTWGDGLFVATELPSQAAHLALSLLERAKRVKGKTEGLSGPIDFRVGLHAGPAFVTTRDPVTGRPNAYGRDVSLAARIEPAAEVGRAWASRVFRVLAAATGDEGLNFKDIGEIELPKHAGKMPLCEVSSSGSRPWRPR